MKEKKEYQKVFKSILKEAKNKRALKGVKTKRGFIKIISLERQLDYQKQRI